MPEGSPTYDPNRFTPRDAPALQVMLQTLLEDRFTSSTSRVQKQLAKLPKGPKFDSLRERVTALVKLADFKAEARPAMLARG